MTTNPNELYHYGVLGMKWRHHKAIQYENKARTARESAKEWDEIGRHKSQKYRDYYKKDGDKEWREIANAKMAKYHNLAKKDLADAKKYEAKASNLKAKKTAGKRTVEKNSSRKVKALKASGKAISYGAQFTARMIQNNANRMIIENVVEQYAPVGKR